VTPENRRKARRIAGFGLTTPDAARLVEFYTQAFGCDYAGSERLEGPAFERCMGVAGGAERHRLHVGAEIIELLQFDHPGSAYPDTSSSSVSSPALRAFQHFALVVTDMHGAIERLRSVAGWCPISTMGPQRLPASSGGVTAYKFRDPDGHPLELLEFPKEERPVRWQRRTRLNVDPAAILGIDHSAISVADTVASVAFYHDLGFITTSHSLNQGPEQSALDGIPNPHVDVTALTAHRPDPHLELLCYRSDAPRGHGAAAANDVAATRIVIVVDGQAAAGDSLVRDPDGHRLHLVTDAWLQGR
jgi:catechol 2,3-dioxygenase-like lactoylglutathione lyase family enzyme